MDDRIFEEFLQSDDNIKKAEEVFDEDFDDMRERRKKRRPWAFPLGTLMLILAAIGQYTLSSSVFGIVKSKSGLPYLQAMLKATKIKSFPLSFLFCIKP